MIGFSNDVNDPMSNNVNLPQAMNGSKMSIAYPRTKTMTWPSNVKEFPWTDDITKEVYHTCVGKLYYNYPCYANTWMYCAFSTTVQTLQGDFIHDCDVYPRSDEQGILAFDDNGVGYIWLKD